MMIDLDGQLWAWGSNEDGILGIGSGVAKQVVPTRVETGGKAIKHAAGGWKHFLAVTEDGELLTWGNNDYGQLGDGTQEKRRAAMVTPLPGNVRAEVVSAGSYQSLVLTDARCGDDALAVFDLLALVFFPAYRVKGFSYQSSSVLLLSSSFSSSTPSLPASQGKWQIAVGTTRQQLQVHDHSGHYRTSIASARSQWALPDLKHTCLITRGTVGPQHCRTSTARARSRGHCRTSTTHARWQWALPDLNRFEVHKVLCLPRNVHFEVHKVLRLPRHLHFEVHQVP